MKGIKVKIDDVSIKNSFDLTKLVVKIIAITKNLTLSETELHALTYFVIHGYSKMTREQLITTKILKNKNSVANLVHAFRKYGIVVKNNLGEEIHNDFNLPLQDIDAVKLEMIIKK